MGEGIRDSFVENDVIGNFAVGTTPLGSMASSNRRKKRKKHYKKVSVFHRRRKRRYKRRKHNRRGVSRGIKYTKNGQPYKIMPNGRARFLKKR